MNVVWGKPGRKRETDMNDQALKKVNILEQDPEIRNKNFHEVALGYMGLSEAIAKEEAGRCLNCKYPKCVEGCPVIVQIPQFIEYIVSGDLEKAYQKITETNSLPAICGRVCPQENQCEAKCVRGNKGEPVAIGRLERFVADWQMQNAATKPAQIPKNGIKVAVVGSGPAGLTCAGDLAKSGYEVTIFEAFHTAGGVLMYGIPEFRLPKALVQKEIDQLRALGVEIRLNMVIGRVYSLEELKQEGYAAIFVGTGAGLPSFMGIPGENLKGVFSANEFLTRINLMKAYKFPQYDTPVKAGKNVAVIGGGNVAVDAARCAKRMGAENVYIVYRRSFEEMPARKEEVNHAKEEGIIFKLLSNPTQILGTEDGWVKAMQCVEMELGDADASGRPRPVAKKGSGHQLQVETVIMAIGQSPNPLLKHTTAGLKTEPWGGIVVEEESGATSLPGVYAGGDAVTGAATVILAMGAGKKAAQAIIKYLQEKQSIPNA